MLLDLVNYALKEQPEDNLMVAISWAWYNGSYIMAAKPIKSLKLHYTMILFLIIRNIASVVFTGTLNPSFNPVLSKENNLAICLDQTLGQ